MRRTHDDRGAYRCVISPENSAAKLKIGKKLHDVTVSDTSRNGFSIAVSPRLARKLKEKRLYELHFCGERWQVSKESSFNDGDNLTTVGFSRVKELTKFRAPSTPVLAYMPKLHAQTDPTFLFFLMLAFLIACISLPGVGDGLGTAPRVRKGVHTIIEAVKDTFN